MARCAASQPLLLAGPLDAGPPTLRAPACAIRGGLAAPACLGRLRCQLPNRPRHTLVVHKCKYISCETPNANFERATVKPEQREEVSQHLPAAAAEGMGAEPTAEEAGYHLGRWPLYSAQATIATFTLSFNGH